MRVVLKECLWESMGDELLVLFDPREAITLGDPDGQVAALFAELRREPRTPAELARSLGVSEADIAGALDVLDSLSLLEYEEHRWLGDPELDRRHFSNLAFFGTFSGLDRPRAEYVRRLRAAHVLVLGVGGGGSSLVQSLAGLGVGRLTLVDRDDVEPRNFARQFLYRHADIGRSKVDRAAEWVREYDPSIEVRAVDRWITGPDDLKDLLDGVDLIAGGLDGDPEAHLWVNEAAVRAGVPIVVGGMTRSQVMYYSVDPGKSACVRCDWENRAGLEDASAEGFFERNRAAITVTNTLIGPLAMQIGSLVAYEALRYLTGFEPPVAAGCFVKLDLRAGLQPERQPFATTPDCPVCGS
ncbi:HesA/MoeB/ThiF family protein [Nonomuraea muscovyensis]|uniref:Molybdopterin/thiamine biosynthesis adenylyltransferase n=1 Tax=Nonomuraea muscovyensis TaxID=1124761 RepID=A0A7X0C0C1_9ACTN|nr:ThiF family adenylyltransferase [Nonomuraea muscovyensis]MBB6346239.1 molybdopterin/thiamine biosynthesis adenylyltransferase [Nonomuraea muscovyensis]MDF2711204.1 ThiF family adenylyltransferase [Nonomuraea muscovyensis]